jgi:hypothetical protein
MLADFPRCPGMTRDFRYLIMTQLPFTEKASYISDLKDEDIRRASHCARMEAMKTRRAFNPVSFRRPNRKISCPMGIWRRS